MTFNDQSYRGSHAPNPDSRSKGPEDHAGRVSAPAGGSDKEFNFGWLDPKSHWFSVLFPDIREAYRAGKICHATAMSEARRSLYRLIAFVLLTSACNQDQDAEDATQELMLRISRLYAQRKFRRGRGSVRAFVGGIRRNVVWEILRSRSVHRLESLNSDPAIPLRNQLDAMLREELLDVLGESFASETKLRRLSLTRKYGSMYGVRAPHGKIENESVNRNRGVRSLRAKLERQGLIETPSPCKIVKKDTRP